MANIAIIGFEFSHMIPAFEKAIERFAAENILATPVIWSARDGLRQEVVKRFPSCVFLDDGKGWHGEYRMPSAECEQLIPPLTDLEKKHFSYTHSRRTYFRDPSRIREKDIIFYEDVLRFCYMLIKKEEVSLCFFADFPHNLLDLGMLYAASRLGVRSLVRDGPYIEDYNFPLLIPSLSRPVDSYPESSELIKSLENELRNRDLKLNLDMPAYIMSPNKTLPKIPAQATLFFHKNFIQNIYKYSGSTFVALSVNKVFYWVTKAICAGYLHCIKSFVATRSMEDSEKSFVLVLLHYHPERTTSSMALDTPFEEERIVKLAKRFPERLILVREHPRNLGNPELMQYRSLRAIKKINSCSNVKYIFPGNRESYRDLIERSLFTISTSGTVAIESIQLGVPSVHMSKSFAEGFPGVITVDDIDKIDLPRVYELRKILQSLTKEELIVLCKDALAKRPMNPGFVCGYHSNQYSNEEYVNKAADIVYSCLSYAAKASPESFEKCTVP